MEEDRRVRDHAVERFGHPPHPPRRVGFVGNALLVEHFGHQLAVIIDHHLDRELGDPFRDHGLRRPVHEHALLELSPTNVEQLLFPDALRVVSRIQLVGHQRDDGVRRDREIGVHLHPASQAASVVVEPLPVLVAHELELERLAVGERATRR